MHDREILRATNTDGRQFRRVLAQCFNGPLFDRRSKISVEKVKRIVKHRSIVGPGENDLCSNILQLAKFFSDLLLVDLVSSLVIYSRLRRDQTFPEQDHYDDSRDETRDSPWRAKVMHDNRKKKTKTRNNRHDISGRPEIAYDGQGNNGQT